MGPLALDVWDVDKRGDPDLVSHQGKLAPLFHEDVESFRVVYVTAPGNRPDELSGLGHFRVDCKAVL